MRATRSLAARVALPSFANVGCASKGWSFRNSHNFRLPFKSCILRDRSRQIFTAWLHDGTSASVLAFDPRWSSFFLWSPSQLAEIKRPSRARAEPSAFGP
jgi:hypothetical protein